MTINQIKADISAKLKISLAHLTMVRQMDETDKTKPTEWLSHWDNENRVRVTMHEEVMKTIQANPTADLLAYKREDLPATDDRASYIRFVIITPRNIEATF